MAHVIEDQIPLLELELEGNIEEFKKYQYDFRSSMNGNKGVTLAYQVRALFMIAKAILVLARTIRDKNLH